MIINGENENLGLHLLAYIVIPKCCAVIVGKGKDDINQTQVKRSLCRFVQQDWQDKQWVKNYIIQNLSFTIKLSFLGHNILHMYTYATLTMNGNFPIMGVLV